MDIVHFHTLCFFAFHCHTALPITYNAFNNFFLRAVLKDEMDSDSSFEPLIECNSHPLPQTSTEKAYEGQGAGFTVAMFLTIGLGFLPLGAVYQIVNDRSNLTKHQQLVSGVSCAAYCMLIYLYSSYLHLVSRMMMMMMMALSFFVQGPGMIIPCGTPSILSCTKSAE